MKVLYIGYYREKSDWGRQTVNNILALDKAGVDVVCRAVELGGTETPQELLRLEKKDLDGVTHCIQHVFPEHLVGTERFQKNVAYFTNNFADISSSSWVERLCLMDEVWVPSSIAWADHLPEKVRERTHIVHQAVDTEVFNQPYRAISVPEIEGDFKFYTICSMSDLVAVNWVMAAFHAEFDPSEPVSLILQAETSGNGEAELKQIQQVSQQVKKLLRLQSAPEVYKKDVIISSPNVTPQDLMSLHQYGDCYISSNPNVSFPLAEIYAAGFGNTPIVSDCSSVVEYIGRDNSVKSVYQIMQTSNNMWKDANNGKDFWIRPCELRLRRKMRELYESKKNKMERKIEALEHLKQFSLESAGTAMKGMLNV